LLFEPATLLPTVTTANSPGFTSQETMVCRRRTIDAASTTGSTLKCRHRAVRALAEDRDPDAVTGREHGADLRSDHARGVVQHVLPERDVRPRDLLC